MDVKELKYPRLILDSLIKKDRPEDPVLNILDSKREIDKGQRENWCWD